MALDSGRRTTYDSLYDVIDDLDREYDATERRAGFVRTTTQSREDLERALRLIGIPGS